MLFYAKFGNNPLDEASSYHAKQFKVHVAVKERINLRDEMDTIITQKYKKDQETPKKKRKDKRGMQKNLGIKKREGADTLNNKVNELKGYVDKFMIKNTCKEYMIINKNIQRVTRTKKYLPKKRINYKQIVGKFRMHAWRKETKLKALVFTSVDKLENSECRNIYWVIIIVFVMYR